MPSFISVLCLAFMLIFPSISSAGNEQAFQQWLLVFRNEAINNGISPSTFDNATKSISFNKRIIELDRKQPVFSKRFSAYLQSQLPKSRIKTANKLYRKHKLLLDKIGNEYGVQPRFIVALWGIESNFGRNMGGFSIIESLATLAYEGRRGELFKSELLHALRIIEDKHVSSDSMKGSWAGAMGQTQFMPSSFLKLAVDYNKDGKKDIWHSKEDAFASIANYLSTVGWDNNTTWGRQVTLPPHFDTKLISSKLSKPLDEWQTLGIRRMNGGDLSSRNLEASLIRPDDKEKNVYLVYTNYKTLLDWNRSLYFATVVGMLSDQIG